MGALRWIVILAAAPLQAQAPSDPPATVRQAIATVEGDSVSGVERRWLRALTRDPADRTSALGLATLAHYTYRDSLAQHFYRIAANGTASELVTGYAALGLARLSGLRGRWAAADSATQQAVAAGHATSHATLLAEALIFLARVRLETAGADAALAMLAEAESAAPTHLGVRAQARCFAAEARATQGDARGALNDALEGARLAMGVGDARVQGNCEHRAALEAGRLFLSDSSLLAYDRAVDAFRKARDRSGLASALQARSEHLRLNGRLGLARRDAEEAIREAEASGNTSVVPWALLQLGQISTWLGDTRTAALQSAEISRLFAERGDPVGKITGPSFEATIALAQGDVAGARAALQNVVEQSSLIGETDFQASGWMGLIWVAMLENDSAALRLALDTTRALIATAGMTGHAGPMSFFEGTIALRYGRLDEAERVFRGRLAASSPRSGNRYYVDAARLAEVLVRKGRLDEGEREIIQAAEQLDAWRQSLDDRRLSLLAFQQATDRADPDLGVASVIAALAGAGRLASAFDVIERSRARELSDRLVRAAALDTTAIASAARSAPPIHVDSLQRALPDDSTAVLEFVTGRGDPTTLFVITRRHARAYVLASQDSLGDRIARLTALLEAGDDPRALGQQLGSALLAPAFADLGPAIRRWIVVPDGPLHRLPFDVLVLPDGRFVVERFAVAIAPAASVAARLWERRSSMAPAGLAVLADPRFARETNTATDADVFRSARAGEHGLTRLRGSTREARAVARYSDVVTVRRRADASETWLKRTPLAEFGVVHFATHALVDEGSVSNTALALAPTVDDDGFIGPSELASLQLAAELVVLSACRTASGVIVRGEGVQGLAAPLIAAGARAVAATWWPIGDVATVRLVDDFYRAMAEGQVAAEALRSAKLAALQRGAPPREWAAFTLVGDPLARPSLRLPAGDRGSALLIAFVGVALALVAHGVLIRRRRGAERG